MTEEIETQGEVKDIIANLKSVKEFKDLVITSGDDKSLIIEKLPYQVDILDDLLSGGLPYGRIVVLYGESSVGKTFLTQKLISSAMLNNKSIAYIDSNKTFHPDWWKYTGVDISKVVVVRPHYGEQAFKIAVQLVTSGIDLLIIDDLDVLVPIAEADIVEDPTKETIQPGQQAKMITTGVRNLVRVNEKAIVVLLNHCKEGIGAFAGHYMPGGKAQKDMSSTVMWLTRGATIKESDVKEHGDDKKRAGFKIRVTLEKDKVGGKQFDFCEIPFIFEDGAIDNIYTLIDIALDLGVIKRTGSSYFYDDKKLTVGMLKLRIMLKENVELLNEIKAKVKEVKAIEA